jgi:deoxyribonuclease-4
MLYGAHVSSAGGISKAIDRAEELRCDAVQVFTQSPRMWRPTAHTEEETARFRARRAEAGIESVVCHALYLVNLASPDREVHAKSVAAMRASLETAAAIDADAVVFHVGSHLGAGLEVGLALVVPALRELLELTGDRLWLVLENSAGAGGTIGRSVDELATIVDRLEAHPRLGVCLDSCHWWVSGVDVTDREALDAAVRELDERIGLDRLRCLHPSATRVTNASPISDPIDAYATACTNNSFARSMVVAPIALSVPNSRMLSTTAENIDSDTITKPIKRPNTAEVPSVMPMAVRVRMYLIVAPSNSERVNTNVSGERWISSRLIASTSASGCAPTST